MRDRLVTAQALPIDANRPSLATRVKKAGSWALFSQVSGQAIRLVSNVLLSRMLAPDSFGLMSVVYMLTVALALFSDLGIGRSVVQSRRGNDPAFLDTAWTLGAIRGSGLGVLTLLIGIAFFIGDRFHLAPSTTVYADPRLPWVVAAFALNVVISSLESIRAGLARRDVRLHLVTMIELASQVVSTAVMVAVAWITRSVWALVFGALFSNSLRVCMGYLLLKGHRVTLRLEPAALKELIGNGRWIFVSSILGFLAGNGDRVLLGGLMDASSFGLYAIAVLLVSAQQTAAFTFSSTLAYPAMSEVFRERPQSLARTLGNFLLVYDALVTFSSGILIVAGPAIIHVLYDQRYQEAGWILSILAIGSIGMRCQLIEQAYQAVGHPKLVTLGNFIRLVGLVGGIWIGHKFWGFTGIVFGVALCQFWPWPVAIWFLQKRKYLTWRGNAMLVPALLAGMLVGWLIQKGVFWILPEGHAALKRMIH